MPNDVTLTIERIGLATARVTMRCGETVLETLLPAAELQSLSRQVLKPAREMDRVDFRERSTSLWSQP